MERKNKAVKDGPVPLTSQDMPSPGLGLQGHNWYNKEHETPKKRAVKHCKYFTLSPQSQYLQPAVLGKGKMLKWSKKEEKLEKKTPIPLGPPDKLRRYIPSSWGLQILS